MKSKHDFNWDIPYEELKYFIEPIKLNTQIPYVDLGINFFFYNDTKEDFIKEIDNEYLSLVKYMPTTKEKIGKKSFLGITHTSHVDGYDFRFNPITVVNNIYSRLRLDYQVPFIDLDQEVKMDYFKNYVKNCNKDIRREIGDIRIKDITYELDGNIDRICELYGHTLDRRLRPILIPKNALFYLAYRNLRLYQSTNKVERKIIPYEYYNYVFKTNTSEYPKSVFFSSKFNKYWYPEFEKDYENEIGKEYIPSKLDLLTGKEEVLALDVLKPGAIEREIRDIALRTRAAADVDYKKYQDLFEMKMNYYMNSDYITSLKGKYGLEGYLGFSYLNEYVLFDKFYNSETLDPSKKTILTHGEAIYALPSDRLS